MRRPTVSEIKETGMNNLVEVIETEIRDLLDAKAELERVVRVGEEATEDPEEVGPRFYEALTTISKVNIHSEDFPEELERLSLLAARKAELKKEILLSEVAKDKLIDTNNHLQARYVMMRNIIEDERGL